MVVTVGSRVLVPEADDVAELVHHDAELVAVLPDGDGLRTAAPPPHVGAAPAGREDGDTTQQGGCGGRCVSVVSVGNKNKIECVITWNTEANAVQICRIYSDLTCRNVG